MAKTYLLKYEPWEGPGYHTRGSMYTLTLLKVSFFGLIKKVCTTSILVEYHHNLEETYKNWDNLISNKTPLT